MLIYYIGALLGGFVLVKKFKFKFGYTPRLLEILGGKYGVLILTLVTFPCLMFSPPFGEVPTIGTAVDTVIYYGLFFTMGVMLFANQTALDRLVGSIKYHLIPFLVCVCILIPLIEEVRLKAPPEVLLQNLALYTGVEAEVSLIGSFPVVQNPFNFTGMNASVDWYLMNMLRAYTAWCGVFLFIALFKSSFSAIGTWSVCGGLGLFYLSHSFSHPTDYVGVPPQCIDHQSGVFGSACSDRRRYVSCFTI